MQSLTSSHLERLHPDALAHLRQSGVHVDALSNIESMPGDILVTPRSRSPIQFVLEDCIKHPHENRLDTLNSFTAKIPGYDGIHTAIFTQQPSLEDLDALDICSHYDFTSDNNSRVSSITHFDKKKGVLYTDSSYGGPWRVLEHEVRHNVDFHKNAIAIRMEKEPEELNTYHLLQQDQAEKNAIENENILAKRLGLPIRTTHDEGASYFVDGFTDSLPSNPDTQKILHETSAKLYTLNEQLLAHAIHITGDVEDPDFSAIWEKQRDILDEVRDELSSF